MSRQTLAPRPRVGGILWASASAARPPYATRVETEMLRR